MNPQELSELAERIDQGMNVILRWTKKYPDRYRNPLIDASNDEWEEEIVPVSLWITNIISRASMNKNWATLTDAIATLRFVMEVVYAKGYERGRREAQKSITFVVADEGK